MKKLIRLFLLLVILLVVGVALLAYYADSLAKKGIETTMTDKLGVATTLDGLSLSFLKANCELDSLAVANPPGYSPKPIFELGRGFVEVSASSLNSDLVEIPLIELEGIVLRLEQKGSAGNCDAILDKIGRGREAPKEEGGKRFVVRKVAIRNTKVEALVMPFGDVLATPPVTLDLAEIVLTDVGSEKPGGMTLSELAAQIMGTVFVKVGDDLSGTLPQLIGQGLTKGLSALPQLQEISKHIEGGVGAGIGGLLKGGGIELEKGLGEGMKKADEAIKKGIGNLLGGDK